MKRLIAFLTLAGYFLSGCGAGQTEIEELEKLIGSVVSDFVVVNLETGAVVTQRDVSDLLTNNKYRTTHMVFRSIDATLASYGSAPGSFGYSADEVQGVSALDKSFVAVFETTQKQWEYIAGASSMPWASVLPATGIVSSSSIAAEMPAYALSHSTVTSALTAYSATQPFALSLPSNILWEHACRAGSTGLYTWGDAYGGTVAGNYAAVSETMNGDLGPKAVATYAANAFGLYDMHGNLWEWTSEGILRGGSWKDGIGQARSANKLNLYQHTEHALVGARLTYIP